MKIKLILLFIFFYVLSLLLTLPAATVANFIPTNANVTVDNAQGAIWHGKAKQILVQKKYKLENVKWQFDWAALLKLQVKVALQFYNPNGVSGEGMIGWGVGGLFAENLMVDLTAPELLSYISLPVPVDINGSISLLINHATQGNAYCEQLDGYLIWRDANIISKAGNVDLQTVDVNLSCVDGNINADLKQLSKQMNSSLNFLLQEGNAYHLQGSIKESPSVAPAIKNALSWLGGKNSEGATIINFKGKL
ncbi:type II secretion system protein N [Psychromonas sp. MME2]|uniref:type II secretion system protein N n=1 Tax=unclassified Psychromonas TaxID=2614957 RepID=UPI00339C567A